MLPRQNYAILIFFRTNKRDLIRTCFDRGQMLTQYATDLDQIPNRYYLVRICTKTVQPLFAPERCANKVRTQGETNVS